MKKTHHSTEQIIRILREAETSGQSHEELCRQHHQHRHRNQCACTFEKGVSPVI